MPEVPGLKAAALAREVSQMLKTVVM